MSKNINFTDVNPISKKKQTEIYKKILGVIKKKDFILGNEVSGVSEELSELADLKSDIPMNGIKQSLNVSVATGIIGYELLRKYKLKK